MATGEILLLVFVFVIAGFLGVENPLFTNDNTVMIYGDAKQTVSSMVSEFDEG